MLAAHLLLPRPAANDPPAAVSRVQTLPRTFLVQRRLARPSSAAAGRVQSQQWPAVHLPPRTRSATHEPSHGRPSIFRRGRPRAIPEAAGHPSFATAGRVGRPCSAAVLVWPPLRPSVVRRPTATHIISIVAGRVQSPRRGRPSFFRVGRPRIFFSRGRPRTIPPPRSATYKPSRCPSLFGGGWPVHLPPPPRPSFFRQPAATRTISAAAGRVQSPCRGLWRTISPPRPVGRPSSVSAGRAPSSPAAGHEQ